MKNVWNLQLALEEILVHLKNKELPSLILWLQYDKQWKFKQEKQSPVNIKILYSMGIKQGN